MPMIYAWLSKFAQTNQQMTPEATKEICDKAGIVFTNQSIGTLLVDLQNQFFKPTREPISKEMRTEIFNEQGEICKGCNEALGEKYELDHIQPVSGGGTNDRDNLQFLCKACHTEKSSEEHSENIKKAFQKSYKQTDNQKHLKKTNIKIHKYA